MNIVLTGFMGTGKSEVGALLAKRLGWQFFDTDTMIEEQVGMPVSEIFARHGEKHFRDTETAAIRLVALMDKTVIACGGGAVLRKENMDELEKNGVVVCLTATPEAILERVRGDGSRPLLKGKDPLAAIKKLLAERQDCYRRCHACVDTSGGTPEEIVNAVVKLPCIIERLK